MYSYASGMAVFKSVVIFFSALQICSFQKIPVSERIKTGVEKLLASNEISPNLLEDIDELYTIENKAYRNEEVCKVCSQTVNGIIGLKRAGIDKFAIQSHVKQLCKMFTNWDETACDGYINIETDTIFYMIDNRNDLNGERVCSIYLQTYGCIDPNRKHWDIVIPPKEETNTHPLIIEKPAPPTKTTKILHLTDIHFDPEYEAGSDAKCPYQLCCQKSSGKPKKPENAAGYWGDYHVCDMPWYSVTDLMSQVKKQHPEIDYVYYTGDIVSHKSWATTIEGNKRDIKNMYDKLNSTFGSIPVYPVLGNHESHPTDFWSGAVASPKISTQWVFDLVSKEWSHWLPSDALETVKNGGYYTVLVKKGYRIIALNSNVCYIANLWLLYNDDDPFGQLQWLANTLKKAETAGELVHILSHVPPGNIQCLMNWNEVFVKIVNRFSNIIKAQFNGHTHYDEFRVFYDKTKTIVTNVAYNGGSFTTFIGLNPNYRVYDVNPKNYEVSDYEQWTYNMTEANLNPKVSPKWYKLYSFKNAYGIPSMSLSDLGKLVKRMGDDKELLKKYYRFEVRDSDPLMSKGCDDNCLSSKLCAIKGVNFPDSVLCNDV